MAQYRGRIVAFLLAPSLISKSKYLYVLYMDVSTLFGFKSQLRLIHVVKQIRSQCIQITLKFHM